VSIGYSSAWLAYIADMANVDIQELIHPLYEGRAMPDQPHLSSSLAFARDRPIQERDFLGAQGKPVKFAAWIEGG
jgi:hypothetical protein